MSFEQKQLKSYLPGKDCMIESCISSRKNIYWHGQEKDFPARANSFLH
jgi:hypothetical protein